MKFFSKKNNPLVIFSNFLRKNGFTERDFRQSKDKKYVEETTKFAKDLFDLGYKTAIKIFHEHFPVAEKPKFIVGKKVSNGVTVFSNNPRWHPSLAEAEKEAERLSKNHNASFTVFVELKTLNVNETEKVL